MLIATTQALAAEPSRTGDHLGCYKYLISASHETSALLGAASGLEERRQWGGWELRQGGVALEALLPSLRRQSTDSWLFPELKDARLTGLWEQFRAEQKKKLQQYEKLFAEKKASTGAFKGLCDDLSDLAKLWGEFQESYMKLKRKDQ
jgi:hypothetical protein